MFGSLYARARPAIARAWMPLAAALVLAGSTGCVYFQDLDDIGDPYYWLYIDAFAGKEKSSPGQDALGLRLLTPVTHTDFGRIYPLAGYQRQWFDGGHDDVFTLGVQSRRVLNESGMWAGGEITYNRWIGRDTELEAVANVFGIGGVAGMPISGETTHLWGSFSILHFGDFSHDGQQIWEGGTGWQLDVGVEVRALPRDNGQ